jgi:hypothetical protein
MGTYLVHGPAQENWMKNCQKIMPVLASGKWFWPSIFAQDDAESGKRVESQTNTCC